LSKIMTAMNSAKLLSSFEESRVAELDILDDWGSAWAKCKKLGLKWGGRGMGGRATGRQTVQTRDVVVEGVTMSYLGTVLLQRTTLRLLHGHRYGLVGRNGVGKSTLLSRISTGTLPGFPPHLRVAQVS
jgi:ABC-type molybdenum transport system ATPase subunit/photorepair protein PhrA